MAYLIANTQPVLLRMGLHPLQISRRCCSCNVTVCAGLLFHGSRFVVCRCVHCSFVVGDTLCQHNITETHTPLSHKQHCIHVVTQEFIVIHFAGTPVST